MVGSEPGSLEEMIRDSQASQAKSNNIKLLERIENDIGDLL